MFGRRKMAFIPSSPTARRASATALATSCGDSPAAPNSRHGSPARGARLELGIDVALPQVDGLHDVHLGVDHLEAILGHAWRPPSGIRLAGTYHGPEGSLTGSRPLGYARGTRAGQRGRHPEGGF